MKRVIAPALVIAVAFVISACSPSGFDIVIDPFPSAEEVFANTDPSTPVRSVTLLENESVVFEVLLDAPVQAEQAIYFELNTNDVDLVLYSSSGFAMASSSRVDVYREGLEGLRTSTSTSSGDLEPQTVSIPKFCRGTCIARNASASKFYLELINRASNSRTFDMFLFGFGYSDEYEFANNSSSGAEVIEKGTQDSGALERIGDSDWWRVTTGGTIDFTDSGIRPGSLEMRMQIYDTDGTTPIPNQQYAPNVSGVTILANEYIRVFEMGDDAAGPAESSLYRLTFN